MLMSEHLFYAHEVHFMASSVLTQEKKKQVQEVILKLEDMVKCLLDAYVLENEKVPKRIVFFRDGVSEGQF